MNSMVEMSHQFLESVLHPQALCIDATLGQGKDTRFFLSHPVRKVHAFEIQDDLCRQALAAFDQSAFHLHPCSHACMKEELSHLEHQIDAVIFNFGWDPKRPGSIMTKPETSAAAVVQACSLLRHKGRMALVFYPHPQGAQEKEAVMQKLAELDGFEVLHLEMPFRNAPSLVFVEKKQK